MKKIIIFIISFLFLTTLNVYADDTAFTVPVGSSFNQNQGAINTFETYTYDLHQMYLQGGDLYFYSNIKNNTSSAKYIAVEVLLFDKDDRNIGIFNYCSDNDYETQFSDYKINPNQSVQFTYKIFPKYLADQEKNTLGDVASYSIAFDNKYCKIGGYDKYKGKTLDEIVKDNNVAPSGSKLDIMISNINRYIPLDGINLGMGIGIVIIIAVLIVCIAIWVAYGAFLNNLHERMYNKKTALAYIPITNNYLCVKMAFGKIIGFSYLGVAFFGGMVSVFGINFITFLASLVLIVAFILDIVKLVTGKYELLYLDTSKNNVIVDNTNNNQNVNQNNNFVQNQTNEYGYSQDNNIRESMMGVNVNNSIEEDDNHNMNVSVGTGVFNSNTEPDNNNSNNNNSNDDSGDSDLSRFFR